MNREYSFTPDVSGFERKIGISFYDPSLLKQALIHSSFVNENPELAPGSYERMEFLGDAILGMIIAEKSYCDFPGSSEGEMTKLRAALVRRDTLARIANRIDLGHYLYLGKGEETGGGREKLVNLAGAFEAVVAAIYLDQGLDTVRSFVLKTFGPDIHKHAHSGPYMDYKSQLQEIIQAQRQITPSYRLIEVSGPDHDRLFTIEVQAGNGVLGIGKGKSKKAAEMEAARIAIENLTST